VPELTALPAADQQQALGRPARFADEQCAARFRRRI
jgi:hypothetical protein